jgi:hypothetical protein
VSPVQVPIWLIVALELAAMPRACSNPAMVSSDTAPGRSAHEAVPAPIIDRPNMIVR